MKNKKLTTYQMAVTALMAAALCVLGPLSVPIGAIPISLSNFVICLTAWLLGPKFGTLSVAVYLLIGLVGGFAPAAAATAEAVRSRELTSQEASALLPACICSGPSFVILTVGEQLLGSRTAGVCLFAAQVLAGWLTAALLCRVRGIPEPLPAPPAAAQTEPPPVLDTILAQAAVTYLKLCGFVLYFRLLAAGCGLLLPAALGGMLSWGVYLLLKGRIESTFYLLVLVGAASAAYAEAAAKLARAPATIFLIPALIPLVPGSYVYYMMSALVLNKLSTMRHYGQLTAEWAFGLAAGIGLIAVLHQIASWKPREKH